MTILAAQLKAANMPIFLSTIEFSRCIDLWVIKHFMDMQWLDPPKILNNSPKWPNITKFEGTYYVQTSTKLMLFDTRHFHVKITLTNSKRTTNYMFILHIVIYNCSWKITHVHTYPHVYTEIVSDKSTIY